MSKEIFDNYKPALNGGFIGGLTQTEYEAIQLNIENQLIAREFIFKEGFKSVFGMLLTEASVKDGSAVKEPLPNHIINSNRDIIVGPYFLSDNYFKYGLMVYASDNKIKH
jgi:hypothetical protein